MKRIVCFAALAALVLGACSKNEISYTPSEVDAVTFGAYSGRIQTKAGATYDMNLANLQKADAGFGVFATYSETNDFTEANNNFMTNEKITWDGNAWTYSPIKYWPNPTGGKSANDQKVSFFAYAPYANPGASETVGVTGFSIDGTSKHNLVHYGFSSDKNIPNVDLMWGYKNGWDKTSTADADRVNINQTRKAETIKFVFQHVLSKLGGSQEGTVTDPTAAGYVANGLIIKANAKTLAPTNDFGSATGTKVTVSSIIVESAPATADDPTVKDIDNGDVVYASGVQTGKLDLFTGEFALDGTAQAVQFKQTITNKIDDPNTAFDESTADSELATIIAEPASFANFGALPTGVTANAVNVYKSESSPIILVPGTKPVVDVTITYTVRTWDEKLPNKYTDVKQTVFGRVKFPAIEQNKKYNLLMILGLNDVKLEATVEDWEIVGSNWTDANNNGQIDPGEVTGTDQEIGLPKNL